MRRTQLYLDNDLWNALHVRARSRKTTISELVREAVRERYFDKREERITAMKAFVGSRREGAGAPEAVDVVRDLRRGNRLERLTAK
jgi:hypothetical protein